LEVAGVAEWGGSELNLGKAYSIVLNCFRKGFNFDDIAALFFGLPESH
jgi:hypothetical protein